MSLAISLIFISLGLVASVGWLVILLKDMEEKYPSKSLPPVKPIKTIEEVIKEALKDPPLGCMWEVKRVIKNYRRVGSNLVFDGTAQMTFAEFKFITPFDSVRPEFTLQIKDPSSFELELVNHVRKSIDHYNKIIQLESALRTEENGGWDGIYS